MGENKTEILVIVGIIVVGLLGGFKSAGNGGLLNVNGSPQPQTQAQKEAVIQRELTDAEYRVQELQKQVQAENDKKYASVYKGQVRLAYVNKSNNASQEFITIQATSPLASPINITGWTLVSTSSGVTIPIPKATKLFFADSQNSEEDVYLTGGEVVYLTTGYSPNGASFKVNKCAGYLSQFQTWNPSLSYSCPAPRNEDTSSIPRSPVNDACLDYIEYMPQCRIQTETLPLNWTYECTNFIYSKINYPSCVNAHKGDKDFYQNEWRIFLKRSAPIWKDRRETIVLYDKAGKIVDILRY